MKLVEPCRMLTAAKAQSGEANEDHGACLRHDTLDDLLRVDVFKTLGAERIIARELVPRAEQHLPHVLYP